jgi:hypothetical protein
MEWHKCIESIIPHLVHISTPRGSGTGWLVSLSATTDLCALATAAHVVDHAHYWEEPIRIFHPHSGVSVLLRAPDRAIHLNTAIDSAAIVLHRGDLPLPTTTLPLTRSGYFTKPGVEIGWIGYPTMHQSNACFFSGRISHFDQPRNRYLVDGVAINGVSGGPTFLNSCPGSEEDGLELIGIVSAYMVNRATGEALPGFAVIQDVSQYYDIAQRFANLDDAKSNETPPEETAEAQQNQEPDATPSPSMD